MFKICDLSTTHPNYSTYKFYVTIQEKNCTKFLHKDSSINKYATSPTDGYAGYYKSVEEAQKAIDLYYDRLDTDLIFYSNKDLKMNTYWMAQSKNHPCIEYKITKVLQNDIVGFNVSIRDIKRNMNLISRYSNTFQKATEWCELMENKKDWE